MGVCILDAFIYRYICYGYYGFLRLFTAVKYSVFIHSDFLWFDLTN